jgi:hypothetical protein
MHPYFLREVFHVNLKAVSKGLHEATTVAGSPLKRKGGVERRLY